MRGSVLILFAMAAPCHAVHYQWSELHGNFDTTVSLGATYSTQAADERYIGRINGGESFTANNDDGRLNYGIGIFSAPLIVSHEFTANIRNVGMFVRGRYFYDFVIENSDPDRTALSDTARKQVGKDVELLDAFIHGDWDLYGHHVSFRLGRQVLSWGESIFIPGGINVINPVDTSLLRTAGSSLKQALLPVGALSMTAGITKNLSVEAYYQYEWAGTQLDPSGTFFSQQDGITPGGRANCLASTTTDTDFSVGPSGGSCTLRGAAERPKNGDQYGIRLNWFVEPLAATEFAAYFVRYHDRRGATVLTAGELRNVGAYNVPNPPNTASADLVDSGQRTHYVEGIRLFGMSFNTNLPYRMTLQGEISWHQDIPVQMAGSELTSAVGYLVTNACDSAQPPESCTLDDDEAFVPSIVPLRDTAATLPTGLALAEPGERVEGFLLADYFQAQFGVTGLINGVLGGDTLVLIAEVAAGHLNGLPGGIRYSRTNATGAPDSTDVSAWGIRSRFVQTYSGVLGRFRLSPQLSVNYDVSGVQPSNVGPGFIEGRLRYSLGLSASYLSRYELNMQYTGVQNNRRRDEDYLTDRDFASVAFKVSF